MWISHLSWIGYIRAQIKSHISNTSIQVGSRHNDKSQRAVCLAGLLNHSWMGIFIPRQKILWSGKAPWLCFVLLPFHFTPPCQCLSFHCTATMAAVYSTGASQLLAITINCISLFLSTVFLSVYQLYFSQFVKLWQAGGGVLNWGLAAAAGELCTLPLSSPWSNPPTALC